MDINHARQKPTTQNRAIDGFFSKPSGALRRPASAGARQPVSPRPGTVGQLNNVGPRRVNDFGRSDGFHAAPRRMASPAPQGVQLAMPPQDSSARRYASAQSLEVLQSKHGFKARRAAKQVAKARVKASRAPSKSRTFRKWSFRVTAVALILLVATGGLLFGKGYLKLKKVFNGSSTAAALHANVDPTLLKGEGDGRVNILLMGIGGVGHDGSDLTDTIIIASIDPVNNQATLLSVPRDLWVKMPNNFISSYQKINAAYESGKFKYLGKEDNTNGNQKAIQAGFAAADSTIESVVGVPIQYNMMVNFQAFQQAVDTVGGVTINAPEQLYDPTMAWQNNHSPILAQAGSNNFNGARALNYVRSRETTSDFARGQRQRAMMVVLKDKVLTAGTLSNPLKLSSLLSVFGSNVQTDISLSDMSRLVSIMKNISNAQIQSVGLTDPPNSFVTTGNINGISVVEPKAGLGDYSAIQNFVRTKLKDGYITKENANVTVLNGTVTPGLATDKATELKSYGYNVGTVANAPTTDYSSTQIIDLSHGDKKYTMNYLKNRYHVATVSTTLPTGIVQGSADIVIILGNDAATISSEPTVTN